MAKCPKCQKEIKFLNKFTIVERKSRFQQSGQELQLESYDVGKPDVFECPECSQQLFDDEEQANHFITQEGEEKCQEK